MMAGVLGVIFFIGVKDQPGAFWGFFGSFLFLFLMTGVGNASTFQMIPNIMRKEIARLEPQLDADARAHARRKRNRRRSPASPRPSPPTAPSSSRNPTAPRSR